MTWDKNIKALAGITGAIAGLFGGWDMTLKVLLVAMILEYITGWIVAILGNSVKTESGHLDSRISWKGLLKKGLALAVVLLGAMLDKAIGQQAAFCTMAVWFYIANEGLSVLENLALAGVPFPREIKNALEQLREKNDEPPDHGKDEIRVVRDTTNE
ncbi:MAG: phage holin family protein [Clostridia bacterium]|nr:phage holin family protein [Clostridia bacterium]